jgi:di/tricarboxylate transporter
VSALLGVIVLLLTRVLTVEHLGRALKIEVVLLIAASLALGRALTETGGTALIASGLATLLEGRSPSVAPVVLLLTMALLTNVVSNSAAAAIGTPIAAALAAHTGAPAEPYILAILFGANLSFATPFGYQTNLLVMSAAGYRFKDFLRVGLPLTLIMVTAFAILLPLRHG